MLTIISSLLTLAAAHSGALVAGGAVGGVVEAAIPTLTAAHRARRGGRLIRRFIKRRFQRPATFEEQQVIDSVAKKS